MPETPYLPIVRQSIMAAVIAVTCPSCLAPPGYACDDYRRQGRRYALRLVFDRVGDPDRPGFIHLMRERLGLKLMQG